MRSSLPGGRSVGVRMDEDSQQMDDQLIDECERKKNKSTRCSSSYKSSRQQKRRPLEKLQNGSMWIENVFENGSPVKTSSCKHQEIDEDLTELDVDQETR